MNVGNGLLEIGQAENPFLKSYKVYQNGRKPVNSPFLSHLTSTTRPNAPLWYWRIKSSAFHFMELKEAVMEIYFIKRTIVEFFIPYAFTSPTLRVLQNSIPLLLNLENLKNDSIEAQ
ncbi:hypothetical protein [Flagellimonas sp.]|uniref:hypothetical protein n=1 Tax=Flagellimonas sp. TaxID=2058762 RepID=UPI003B5284BE